MRCWYTRWQISNAVDNGELASRMARGHAARCPVCQAYARALGELHEQLSSEAHAAAVPLVPVRSRRPWLVAPLALGAAGALAVIAIGVGTRELAAPSSVAVLPAPPGQLEPAPAPDGPGPLTRVRGLADRVTRALERSPLETELDDLIHDGRRGLDAVLASGGLANQD